MVRPYTCLLLPTPFWTYYLLMRLLVILVLLSYWYMFEIKLKIKSTSNKKKTSKCSQFTSNDIRLEYLPIWFQIVFNVKIILADKTVQGTKNNPSFFINCAFCRFNCALHELLYFGCMNIWDFFSQKWLCSFLDWNLQVLQY